MCPAGIQPCHGARGPRRTAAPVPREQDLSATGKVQVQGAQTVRLYQHPPQHSSASAAPQAKEPQEPRDTLVPSVSLPPQLQHHTTAHHLRLLRGALPVPSQTPQPHPLPQHRFGASLHRSGEAGCSWRQAGHLGRGSEGGLEPGGKQGSAPQCSQTPRIRVTAQLRAAVLHKKKQTNKAMRFSSPKSGLFCPTFEKPLRFRP